MDILNSLTTDFDHLRDLTIDLALVSSQQEREQAFRQLQRFQDVTLKAQAAAMNQVGELTFAQRRLLERADVMEDIAIALHKTRQPEVREMKMSMYADLVLQGIQDAEREVLPQLFDNLTETERTTMGDAYTKYCAIALDLPHAS